MMEMSFGNIYGHKKDIFAEYDEFFGKYKWIYTSLLSEKNELKSKSFSDFLTALSWYKNKAAFKNAISSITDEEELKKVIDNMINGIQKNYDKYIDTLLK